MTNTVAGIHEGLDTHANRPAATAVTAGTLYSCSDHNLIYRSNGATWATWATVGSSSGGVPAFSGAKVYKSVDQDVLVDGVTTVTFDTTKFDTDTFFDNANDELDAATTAYYLVGATVALISAFNVEDVSVVMQHNGSNIIQLGRIAEIGSNAPIGDDRMAFSGSVPVSLTAGDAIKTVVSIDTGGNLAVDIRGGNEWATNMWIVRLGT